MKKYLIILLFLLASHVSFGQVSNTAGGRILIGTDFPYRDYDMTIAQNGIYFKYIGNNFLQFDVNPTGSPRIAGTSNKVSFYNSQTNVYNAIQVSHVYTYSDARAKTDIKDFRSGLDIVMRLRPVSYCFRDGLKREAVCNKYTGNNTEIGLLAQEVEQVLPNLVISDDEGHKLVNYVSLIPVLVDAVNSIRIELELLKDSIN